jgi:carbonic anhydrase
MTDHTIYHLIPLWRILGMSRSYVPEERFPLHTEANAAVVPRRKFLGLAAATVLSAAAPIGFMGTPARAQSTLSSDDVLKLMMEGNERVALGNMTSFEHDLKILRDHNADKQEPFAAVLACADSRVPVELIFDQTIGHIFVTRVAGNIVTPEIIGSLEYGAAVLGIKVILVLGHAGCGAVKAAIQNQEVPGQISALYPHIRPAIDKAGSNLDAVIRANAVIQAKLLAESSPVIAPLVKGNKLKLAAGVYDIASGRVILS